MLSRYQARSSRIIAPLLNVFVNYVYACAPTGKNLVVLVMHYEYERLCDA